MITFSFFFSVVDGYPPLRLLRTDARRNADALPIFLVFLPLLKRNDRALLSTKSQNPFPLNLIDGLDSLSMRRSATPFSRSRT